MQTNGLWQQRSPETRPDPGGRVSEAPRPAASRPGVLVGGDRPPLRGAPGEGGTHRALRSAPPPWGTAHLASALRWPARRAAAEHRHFRRARGNEGNEGVAPPRALAFHNRAPPSTARPRPPRPRSRPPRPGLTLHDQAPPSISRSRLPLPSPALPRRGLALYSQDTPILSSSVQCQAQKTLQVTVLIHLKSNTQKPSACGPPEKDEGRETSSCRDLECQAKQQISSVDPCQKTWGTLCSSSPLRDYSMFWVAMVGTNRSPELSDHSQVNWALVHEPSLPTSLGLVIPFHRTRGYGKLRSLSRQSGK